MKTHGFYYRTSYDTEIVAENAKICFSVFGDKFSIIGSPIVKAMRFHRIVSRFSVFYRISPISMNLSPKTLKIFSKKSFQKKMPTSSRRRGRVAELEEGRCWDARAGAGGQGS